MGTMRVNMGEGRTPLVESVGLVGPELRFKLETTNPTGSYKDRFIAAELQRVLDAGMRVCVATSSGNTGAALAAYCARYGVKCVILVNADAPVGKLMQMQAHGAMVVRIPEFVTSPEVTEMVFRQLGEFTSDGAAALVVSAFRYCPVGMSGVKAIAREIVADWAEVEHVFAPVGGGGLFAAVSEEMGRIAPGVRVHAVQPEGCPTVLNAYRENRAVEAVPSTTKISGLSVPFDIDASLALRLVREGGGEVLGVTDEAVYAAQKQLYAKEGIGSEPAGATALAGYWQARERGLVRDGARCVCLVTGSGFKDPASMEVAAKEKPGVTADPARLLELLGELAG